MAAKSPRSGHEITSEQASKGGKNGKRGPSITTKIKKFLAEDVPPELIALLDSISPKDKKYHSKIYALLKENKSFEDYIALVQLIHTMMGQSQASKLVIEQTDGKARETIKHEGDMPMNIKIVLPEE